jgi:hypothetical protein
MEKTPLIGNNAPEGKYTLAPNKEATTFPGITLNHSEHHIEVTYQSRFALFDANENIAKPII